MKHLETKALIIRGNNYGESDRILTLVTEDIGKTRGIAKGARKSLKRFGGALEPFTLVRLVIRQGRDLAFINDARVVKSYKNIKNNLEKISYGSYMLELTDALYVEEQAHETGSGKPVFSLLLEALDALDELSHIKEAEAAVRVFEIRLLSLSGYMPSLITCASCGDDVFHSTGERGTGEGTAFSYSRGGALCWNCGGQGGKGLDFISPGTLRTLSGALKGKVSFTQHALGESERLLSAFISQHIGKKLRSLDFIEQMKGTG